MDTLPIVKKIAARCIERMNHEDLNLGKKKKRDDAALHYFVGAAVSALEAGNTALGNHLQNLVLLISVRGFSEVELIAKQGD